MKIAAIETIRVQANPNNTWLFVQVRTDDGLVGTGEASDSGQDDWTESLILNGVAPHLLGEDPREVEMLWGRLVSAHISTLDRAPTRPVATALSGVEIALCDLASQYLGIPLYALLGSPQRTRIPLYANLNRAQHDRSPEALAATARAAVAAGFKAVKCMPFDEVIPHEPDRRVNQAAVERGIARVAAVRDAIGAQVDLMVDCHGRFTRDLAIEVGHQLATILPYWYEEPIRPGQDLEGLVAVAAALDTPVAAGEHLFGSLRFEELISARAADILMPDVKHCGGIREAYKIARLAEAAGLLVAPHNPSGPISTLASVHLAAAVPNFVVLEYPFDEVAWRPDLVNGAERLAEGALIVPKVPGVGAGLNPKVLAERGTRNGAVVAGG